MTTNYTHQSYICTLRLKSLWPLGSAWGKTTLNTGSVGEAGAGPSNLKNGVIFSYVLGTSYTNLQQSQIKWSFRGTLKQIVHFYCCIVDLCFLLITEGV